jgi:hypothetical protein
MMFFVILALCVPVFLFGVALRALVSQKRALAVILGLSSATTVVALASLAWQAYAVWNPTPHHFQDVDHIPDFVHVPSCAGNLRGVGPIDHIYYYSTRTLRCSCYLRCHIVHKKDFERYRKMFRKSAEKPQATEKEWAAALGASSGEYKVIRSWWDWPDRPDCEVCCLARGYLVVLDEKRSIVYVAQGDD